MILPEVKLAVQQLYRESGMVFRSDELEAIEYADFGLNDFEREGLSLIIYDNNERYCAKELVLLPEQICPEHRQPERNGQPGKQETFRCRKGSVDLFVEGPESGGRNQVPKGKESVYTVFHHIHLEPGQQFVISPNTKHWFKAGSEGAIVSEFSSSSDDASDVFTDPNIRRVEP